MDGLRGSLFRIRESIDARIFSGAQSNSRLPHTGGIKSRDPYNRGPAGIIGFYRTEVLGGGIRIFQTREVDHYDYVCSHSQITKDASI